MIMTIIDPEKSQGRAAEALARLGYDCKHRPAAGKYYKAEGTHYENKFWNYSSPVELANYMTNK